MTRTNPFACGVILLVVGATLVVPGAAAGKVVTVSPGETGNPNAIAGACPTFSWSRVAGAEGYELVVYEVSEDGLSESGAPTLARALPAGVSSWTPGLDDCLSPGATYAWVVRAVGEDGAASEMDWSETRLFRTEGGPESEGRVLEVLRRYLRSGGSVEKLLGVESAALPVEHDVAEPVPARRDLLSSTDDKVDDSGPETQTAGLAIPPTEVGLTAEILGGAGTVAVRGQGFNGVFGYLGLAVSDTSGGEFDGLATLKLLDEDEIGVLGVSDVSGSDNYGVVGVADTLATAGRFLNVDGSGNVRRQVLLGTNTHAISALGDVEITGTISCPLGTFRVGGWCIGQEQFPRNYISARTNCWNQGMQLCPLQAILACDVREPAGSDCAITTDLSTEKWIWCEELEDSSNDDRNAFTGSNVKKARVYAGTGNNTANELDWHIYNEVYVSYCCVAR